MTPWQWILYAAAFLLIGSLMTFMSAIAGFVILGKDGCRQYIGRVCTLDNYYGTIRFMGHMAASALLVLLVVLLDMRVNDPTELFQGMFLALWPALSLIAAALGVLSIALRSSHPEQRAE